MGMFSSAISSSLMPSRCLTRARKQLPCAATSTTLPSMQVGAMASYQYGQQAGDHVLQAFGARDEIGGSCRYCGECSGCTGWPW